MANRWRRDWPTGRRIGPTGGRRDLPTERRIGPTGGRIRPTREEGLPNRRRIRPMVGKIGLRWGGVICQQGGQIGQ